MTRLHVLAALAAFGLSCSPALAQQAPCGGDYGKWLNGVAADARAAGVGNRGLAELHQARLDQTVIRRDRAQGVFTQTFITFSSRMVNNYRLRVGASNLKKYAHIFRRAEAEFGVPGPVISAFWGLETDYGAVQGDFDTLNALTTLSYDCRRPELFRPQLIALLKLFDQGVVDASTTGAWAGEIGQTQMLPKDYLSEGTDGDGDGRVDLKHSVPDVIMTTAKFLRDLGWKRGEPWLQEVRLTRDLPWDQAERTNRLPVAQWEQWGVKGRSKPLAAGMKASLILPMGRNGPAFLSYPNYDVFLEWNKSFVYSLTAAYFATRLDGAPRYEPGNPSPGLDAHDMKALQEKLVARGYDVGKVDGILGSLTREAVRQEQRRLGLPADAWPTKELLARL